MRFLVKKHSTNKKAHIWNENDKDSYCRMYSTGGLGDQKKLGLVNSLTRDICQNCIEKYQQKHGCKPTLKRAAQTLFQ